MSATIKQSESSQNSISEAQNPTSFATNLKNPIQKPSNKDNAKYAEKIKFPFIWEYATITKLTKKEKLEVNQPRGRKRYRKPCAICGGNGEDLEYRKKSDVSSCLLCEECAIDYVFSAMKISHAYESEGNR